MSAIAGTAALEQRLERLTPPLAVVLPGGRRIGSKDAAVTVRMNDLAAVTHLVTGRIGKVGEDYVEGRIDIDGGMRDVMALAAELMAGDPTQVDVVAVAPPVGWLQQLLRLARSKARHRPEVDAEQIQFHYDVSDDFYALWLDPRRVYSCAYYRDAGMDLAAAQEAKLEHICRKLMLKEGERFLDIGAGWGGLLLHAAENYGVQARGITLSRNQHAHVNKADPGARPAPAGCGWTCSTTAAFPTTSRSTRSPRSACSSMSAGPSCRPTSPRSTACSSRAGCC